MAIAQGITANISGETNKAECNNCREVGLTTDSVSFCCECDLHLCISCDKMHAKTAPAHKVYYGKGVPRTDMTHYLFGSCSEHREETVEFYCTQHDSVICQLCSSYHSNCFVQDMSAACKKIKLSSISRDMSNTITQLLQMQEKISQLTREKQLILRRYRTDFEERRNVIKTLKSRFINAFENYDSQLESHEISLVNTNSATIHACTALNDQLKHLIALLQRERDTSDKQMLFRELINAKNTYKNFNVILKEIQEKSTSCEISIKEDKNLPALFDKLSTLVHKGVTDSEEVVENSCDEGVPKKKSFFNIKACSAVKETNCQVQNDKQEPYISGCCWTSDGQAILCDYCNEKIKILDEEMNIKYTASCSSAPWDISCLNESSAVITLPKAKALQFISIKPGFKFNQRKELKLACYGIGVHNKNIYVGINNSDPLTKGVKILTIKGDDVSFIPHLGSGYPRYLRLNADGTRLYYSEGSDKDLCINCVTTDGYGIFSISSSEMKYPRSIIHDEHDNIMVCDDENKCVIIISSEGKCGNKLLTEKDNIYKPKSMCLNKSYDRLLVASWMPQSSGPNLSKIKIFQLEYQ